MLRTHGVNKKDSDKANSESTGLGITKCKPLSFNYRTTTDIQAALGCTQLKKLAGFVKRRREIAANSMTKPCKDYTIHPIKEHGHYESSYHLYVVQIDFERIVKQSRCYRNRAKRKEVGPKFITGIPIVDQPYYKEHVNVTGNFNNCPNVLQTGFKFADVSIIG